MKELQIGQTVFIGATHFPVEAKLIDIGQGEWKNWVGVEVKRLAIGQGGGMIILPETRGELRCNIFETYEDAHAALRAKGW